jgi:transcription elongation factor Elf1
MEESHQVNTECISCSFKGSIEVKKGKKIYEMSCSECGNKTLRERRKPRRVKGHDR